MTMNYIYRQRYERYLNESDNRFASVDEVKAQAVPVSLEDLKRGKKTAGGFPMLVERDSVWVDPADHHTIIYGATGSGKTRRLILLLPAARDGTSSRNPTGSITPGISRRPATWSRT